MRKGKLTERYLNNLVRKNSINLDKLISEGKYIDILKKLNTCKSHFDRYILQMFSAIYIIPHTRGRQVWPYVVSL